jgi:hypothetical protein
MHTSPVILNVCDSGILLLWKIFFGYYPLSGSEKMCIISEAYSDFISRQREKIICPAEPIAGH